MTLFVKWVPLVLVIPNVCFNFRLHRKQTWLRPEVIVISYVFVILTCCHLTGFFGEEKFSEVHSKNKVADGKKLVQCGKFSSAILLHTENNESMSK